METNKKMELIESFYEQMSTQEFRDHLKEAGFGILEDQPGTLTFADEYKFEIESVIPTATYRLQTSKSTWEVQSVALRNVG